jgi:hypothetical protein
MMTSLCDVTTVISPSSYDDYSSSSFFFLLSFLGFTAQLRPWPLPENPAEFLGGFSTTFFFTEYGC